MAWLVPGVCLLLAAAQGPAIDAVFVQVAPVLRSSHELARSAGQTRAVVLIEGFSIPFSRHGMAQATFHSYQRPNSSLVKTVSQEADVFDFAYGQNLPVADIVPRSGLGNHIHALHNLGYREIVLVGFSAGGLVARQLVEDLPDAGVTKVVQVCSPNGGTGWALVGPDAFARSLGWKPRQSFLLERWGKRIPEAVQFACIVANGLGRGDGVVSIQSQWPPDLQEQGIPAFLLHTEHLLAARTPAGVKLIAELVREELPRWDAARVAIMRKKLHASPMP